MPPLFFGIAFYELLINIFTCEREDVLLKVCGRLAGDTLALNDRAGFRGGSASPEGIERVHVERHVVEFAVKISDGGVDEIVELAELLHIVPSAFVVGSENMSTIFMHINAVDILGVAVSTDVAPFVYYEHALPFG